MIQGECLEKILITGHTGFLGQSLIKSLKQKYELIGISRKIFDSDIINIKMLAKMIVCPIWEVWTNEGVQNTRAGSTKLLPTRPANSENFCFSIHYDDRSDCAQIIEDCIGLHKCDISLHFREARNDGF